LSKVVLFLFSIKRFQDSVFIIVVKVKWR